MELGQYIEDPRGGTGLTGAQYRRIKTNSISKTRISIRNNQLQQASAGILSSY